MNKSVAELVNEKELAVQLIDREVKEFTTEWTKIAQFKFPQDELVVTRIQKYDRKAFNLIYFDDVAKIEKSVVVPPDFMFKMPENDKAREIIKRYEERVIAFLNTRLGFSSFVGSDPEIFVENKKGKLIPAFEFLPSKEKRLIISGSGTNSEAAYWDGFQAEFTTYPNGCFSYHADSIQRGLSAVLKKAREFDKTAKLSTKTVMDIPLEVLNSTKPEHVEFGCMKSLNAYGMKGLDAPGNEVLFRSAGGHIHFGTGRLDQDATTKIVKALDAILGVACVSLFASFDNPRRREMYGLAGEYRLPPHGIEYRTLSNAWLFHPVIANLVFDLARSVLVLGQNGWLKYWEHNEEDTVKIINTCDVEHARFVLNKNLKMLEQIVDARYKSQERTRFVTQAIMNGMELVIKDPADIEGNWHLTGKWVTHCNAPNCDVTKASLTWAKDGSKV